MSTRQSSKTHVTANERLQLIGLLVLAKRYAKHVDEIQQAIQEITGEVEDNGHSQDAIYSEYGVDGLLDRLDLKVKER